MLEIQCVDILRLTTLDTLLDNVYNFPQMYNESALSRREAVDYYLSNSKSLKQTAVTFGVHYQTVYKWVKIYREQGMEGLLSRYHRPWNRPDPNLEEKVVSLKERYPAITLILARQMLAAGGIKMSIKGIASVWKRFGYAGYEKNKMSNEFIDYIPWSRVAEDGFQQAKALFDMGYVERSAGILNGLPVLPRNDLLIHFPARILGLRRRLEKAFMLFGKTPIPEYLKMVRRLQGECKKKSLHYSALRIGIVEAATLGWTGKCEEQLEKINELRKYMDSCSAVSPVRRSGLLFEPHFTLLVGEAIAYAHTLKIRRGYEIANHCARLLKTHKHVSPHFLTDLGTVYSNLEDYSRAEYWFKQALFRVDQAKRQRLEFYLAYHIGFAKGDFRKARFSLKEGAVLDWVHRLWKLRLQALSSFTGGNPSQAIKLATQCLNISKKSELHRDIFNTCLTIACAYQSLGENAPANRMLARLLVHLVKNRLNKQTLILRMLLGHGFDLSDEVKLLPSVRVLKLLRENKYWRAYRYARNKGIIGNFFRYVFFFPDVVRGRLSRGRLTGLPRSILKLPIFNKEAIVYNIRFLGNPVIYRNQSYLKTILPPKNAAFVIFLALEAGEPGKRIPLADIYRNFFASRTNAGRSLSRLLAATRKSLRLPTHFLEISYQTAEPALINRGLHFISDLGEFEQSLTTARAFEKSGEWSLAKREFLRAFRLFRDSPFRKMYDAWSESTRLRILNALENEVLRFIQICREHGDQECVRGIIDRTMKIIPASDAIKEQLSMIRGATS